MSERREPTNVNNLAADAARRAAKNPPTVAARIRLRKATPPPPPPAPAPKGEPTNVLALIAKALKR